MFAVRSRRNGSRSKVVSWAKRLWPRGGSATIVSIAVALAIVVVTGPMSPRSADASGSAPIELVGKRTATSETFRNGDGTFTTSVYAMPIHYLDASGEWKDIDSTLVPSSLPGYGLTNRANAFHVQFKDVLGDDYLRFAVHGRPLTFSLQGALGSHGVAHGARLHYSEVLKDVALDYATRADGVEETLTLAEPSAPATYRFTLDPHGATLFPRELPGGSWEFLSPGVSGPLFVLAAPRAVDAHGKDGSSHAHLDVTRTGSKFAIALSVDASWLHDKDRAFPVRIDPTITLQPSTMTGNFDISCGTCTDTGTPLWTGVDDTDTWRTLLRFDLSQLPPASQITQATVGLWNDSANCVPVSNQDCEVSSQPLELHRVTAPWDDINTQSRQLAFDSTVLSTATVGANAPDGWVSWSATGLVQNWANGAQPNYGVLIKRSTEPHGAGGPAFPGNDAYDPTQAPKLTITYKGDGVTLSPPGVLHSSGAELQWTKWDGSSGNPFGGYEIHRSTDPAFIPSTTNLVATIGDPAVTAYTDTTAKPSTTFTYKIVVNGVSSYPQTVTLPPAGLTTASMTLTPANSRATYLEKDSTSVDCSNYGGTDTLMIGADGDPSSSTTYRPTLTFDLPGIPSTAKVTNATLKLYADTMPPTHTINVEAHRMTGAWQQGTGGLPTSSTTCTGDGATWYESDGGVSWHTQGGDFDPTVAASVQHTAADDAGWDSFNIASIVQQWVNGTAPNLGVLFKFNDETPDYGNWFTYYTGAYTWDPTLRPQLQLTYNDGNKANPPSVAIAAPAAGAEAGGTVHVTAAASDDGHVAKVAFLVDGTQVATATSAPFAFDWNSATVGTGKHTLTATATDDAGNATTSGGVTVDVDNTAAPTTSVTSPAANATVSGTATVTANAADDRGVTHVEFYVDGNRFADTTTSPYSASLTTTSTTDPVYDGTHTLTTKAYDLGGHVTTSAPVTIKVANAPAASEYAATLTSTDVPQAVTYDPNAQSQQPSGFNVTVTNTSPATWNAANVVLQPRWISSDATPLYTNGTQVPLSASVAPSGSKTISVSVTPPPLPAGVERAQYTLRFDLYDKSTGKWFADQGNHPLDNPVIVNKALDRDALGLEQYYHYVGSDLGGGMQQLTNVANGNSIIRWTPFDEPGKGLATVLDLTYNALEQKCDCPAGNNWSLAVSTLTRLGQPLDIHPNKADQISGISNKYIDFTDGDGTTHRFTDSNSDGYWEAPAGVHLYLRQYSTTDTNKYWALTRPDRVTFFYDQDGFPTSVVDSNGNTITDTESAIAPGDDPGGAKKHITSVTDQAGRRFGISYYTKADAKRPQIRGKVEDVTDHMGRDLHFDYYFDGNLLRITQRGGTNADGTYLADRSWVFTYTTSDGSGPAIPATSARVNPDPTTANESTRLYSVRDPRGSETLFSYLGPGNGTDRWKLASISDRGGNQTTLSYDTINRVTTVTAPLSRISKYGYDVEGKLTTFTDPLGHNTTFQWSADRELAKVTEPSGASTSYAYNDNGAVTSTTDQLGDTTAFTYANTPVDGNDTSTHWETGRTIPHISDFATRTDPKGVATTTVANDYQWIFAHDGNGNTTRVTDPLGDTTTNAYNADGTLATTTDPNNHTTTYAAYDANGEPTSVIDPLGHKTTATYDAAGELTSVQDPIHQSFTTGDPRTYQTVFDYDSFGRLARTTTPKSTSLDPGDLIWSGTSYDANDNVVGETSPHYGDVRSGGAGGDVAAMTYDTMDRLTSSVVPHDPTSSDPTQQSAKTTWSYDAAGRLTVETDPKGVLTTNTDKDFATYYGYDQSDRETSQTRYEVDANGNVTRTERTHTCYDLAGDVRSETSPIGDAAFPGCPSQTTPYTALSGNYTTSYAYNSAHDPLSTTDALGHTQSSTYDANGNIDSTTDENGTTSSTVYDQAGQVVKEIQPFRAGSTAKSLVTQYEYDPAGNLKRLISPRAYDASTDKKTFTDFVSSFEYDANDELVREIEPTSSADPQQLYVHHAYDADGRQTWASVMTDQADPTLVAPNEKSTFTYLDTAWPLTTKDPAEAAVTYDYTAAGEQSARTRAGDPTETWSYFADGSLKQAVDPNGSPTMYGYDANGNLTTLSQTRGVNTPDETTLEVQQTYDGFDQTAKVRHQKLGKPWQDTTYAYDLEGNVSTQLDNATENADGTLAGGRATDYSYDAVSDVTSQVDHGTQSGCADDQRVQYTYSAAGDQQDEMVSRPSASCTVAAPGWTIKQQTSATYFLNGQPKTVQTWNGPAATAALVQSHSIAYEDSNSVYLDGNVASDSFSINGPSSAAPCQASANPCTATYTYDAKDRLVASTDGHGGSSSFSLLPNSMLRSETTGGKTTNFTYNAPNGSQLRSATAGATTQRFFYTHGALTCVAQDDSTTQASLADCPDPTGSVISPRLVQTYAYDTLDRLKGAHTYSAGNLSDSGQWTYDALDRATSEAETHTNGSVNRTDSFVYNGLSGQLENETWAGSNPTTKNYTYDPHGALVGETDAASGRDLLYGFDARGDVSQLIDAKAGTATATYGYQPYGQEESAGQSSLNQGDSNSQSPLNAYRFDAMRTDAGAAQADDMGSRQYAPQYGSFLQQDYFRSAAADVGLATDPSTATRYGFTGGNPINFADPDGHRPGAEHFGRAHPRFASFDLPAEPGVGIVHGGYFIKRKVVQNVPGTAWVTGDLNGNDRGFMTNADPSRFKGYLFLNFSRGHGYLRVNPTCNGQHRDCRTPWPMAKQQSFLGSIWSTLTLQHKNRIGVDTYPTGVPHNGILDETGLGVDISTNLQVNLGRHRSELPTPSITDRLRFNFSEFPGGGGSGVLKGDHFPSAEFYESFAGETRTLCRAPERGFHFLPGQFNLVTDPFRSLPTRCTFVLGRVM